MSVGANKGARGCRGAGGNNDAAMIHPEARQKHMRVEWHNYDGRLS